MAENEFLIIAICISYSFMIPKHDATTKIISQQNLRSKCHCSPAVLELLIKHTDPSVICTYARSARPVRIKKCNKRINKQRMKSCELRGVGVGGGLGGGVVFGHCIRVHTEDMMMPILTDVTFPLLPLQPVLLVLRTVATRCDFTPERPLTQNSLITLVISAYSCCLTLLPPLPPVSALPFIYTNIRRLTQHCLGF